MRSCVAHCVAECVAECCRVLQGHRNVATRFHKTPQVLCGELLSSLARQTLSRSWVQAHNTEPCLDQTTFASLCSLAVHLVLFHGLVLPIVYQAAIKNFKTNHNILSHRAGSCASLSNSVALPQELHAKKHMHTLRPAVSRYTAQDCPCLQFHGPEKGA